ncbi:MAG: hypothetical protein K0R60_5 [Microbacterium sp.]|jgi:hypothetical protein|nr:hypothetical protein [Microbacterium sp.]
MMNASKANSQGFSSIPCQRPPNMIPMPCQNAGKNESPRFPMRER